MHGIQLFEAIRTYAGHSVIVQAVPIEVARYSAWHLDGGLILNVWNGNAKWMARAASMKKNHLRKVRPGSHRSKKALT